MKTLIGNLLFPPVCAGCGDRFVITPENHKPPLFCPRCALDWELAMREGCPTCGLATYQCTCMRAALLRVGVKAHVKLANYDEVGSSRVVRYVVLDMKRKRRPAMAKRCAADLSPGVLSALAAAGVEKERTMLVSLPRSQKTRCFYGFDQARILARALSAELEIPYSDALYRTRRAKVQKTLSEKERFQNLAGVFSARPSVVGQNVILVDDVVTTGASMAHAAKTLLGAGALSVIAVSLASTKKKRKRA